MFLEQKTSLHLMHRGNVLRISTWNVISLKKNYHTPILCKSRLKEDRCTILHGCRKRATKWYGPQYLRSVVSAY